MTIRVHRGDLPDLSHYRAGAVAIDTETMGLDPHRDRLCVVQLSPGDGTADVVQIPAGASEAPNLTKLLADGGILKIFHFARFDLGVLQERLAVMARRGVSLNSSSDSQQRKSKRRSTSSRTQGVKS